MKKNKLLHIFIKKNYLEKEKKFNHEKERGVRVQQLENVVEKSILKYPRNEEIISKHIFNNKGTPKKEKKNPLDAFKF